MKKISEKQFNEYLKENLNTYILFKEKAMEFQMNKNNKRKNKWNVSRLEKEVKIMWDNVVKNTYNQISYAAKQNNMPIFSFISENDVLEHMNDSISELDFSEDN